MPANDRHAPPTALAAIRPLVTLARALRRPRNYYAGAQNLLDALPREVLAFSGDHRLSGEGVSAHHRFVLVVCLEGPGTLVVDSRMHALSPLDAVLVFPFEGHHYARIRDERVCWLFVTFELEAAGPLEPLRGRQVRLEAGELDLLQRVTRCCAGFSGQARRSRAGDPPAREAGAWLALLLGRLRSRRGGGAAAEAPADPDLVRLQCVLHRVHQDPHRAVEVHELAREVHLSASHLRRFFQRRMGVSLGRYVRQARLDKAIGLLRRADLSVSQVADACGFSSLFAFSRAFKAAMGVSPRAFRGRRR